MEVQILVKHPTQTVAQAFALLEEINDPLLAERLGDFVEGFIIDVGRGGLHVGDGSSCRLDRVPATSLNGISRCSTINCFPRVRSIVGLDFINPSIDRGRNNQAWA